MRDHDDPEVRQAEAARDQARARYDQADAAWKTLAYERLVADMWGKRTRELAEREAAARQARDDAWKPVVAANERLRAAQHQARMRLGAAEQAG
jgi:hypothetical protein